MTESTPTLPPPESPPDLLPSVPAKKRRVWILVQASSPDGFIAHEGDMELEVYLDHWNLEALQRDLNALLIDAQLKQRENDRTRRRLMKSIRKRERARLAVKASSK